MAGHKQRKTSKPAKRLRDVPVGALVRQPHGGALRNGGTNKGGPGRPPEYLRIRSRDVYDRWLTWAEQQTEVKEACKACGRSAQDPAPDVMNQIGKTAGRFGFPSEDMVSRQFVRERLQKQIEVLLAALDSNNAERAINAIQPVWFPS